MQLAPTKRRRRRLRPRGRRRRAGRRRRSRTRAGWRRGRRDEHLRPAARRRRRGRGRRSFQRTPRRRRRRGRFKRASRRRWRRWRGRFRHASRRRWRRRRGRFRHASRRRRRGRRRWWLGHTDRWRWRRWRRWRWLQCPARRRRRGPSSRADSSPRGGLRLRRSFLFSGFSARFVFYGARERLRRAALQRERNRGRRRQRRFRSVGRRVGVGIGRVRRNLVEIRDARVFLRWPTFRVCFSSRNRDVLQRATSRGSVTSRRSVTSRGSVTSRHFGTPLFSFRLRAVATRRGSRPFAFWSVAFQFLYRARGLAPARRRAERVGARRRLDFARFAF